MTTVRPAAIAADSKGRRCRMVSGVHVVPAGSLLSKASSMVFRTQATSLVCGSAMATEMSSCKANPGRDESRGALWKSTDWAIPPAFAAAAKPDNSRDCPPDVNSPLNREVRLRFVSVGSTATAEPRRSDAAGMTSAQPSFP
ncbi:hypothetical protein D9M72_571290 [compost metagenome]